MEVKATEVDPDYFLRVSLPERLSTRQLVALRRLGPGLAERPPHELLQQWRCAPEVLLGPFCRRYQAVRAREELLGEDFSVLELVAK